MRLVVGPNSPATNPRKTAGDGSNYRRFLGVIAHGAPPGPTDGIGLQTPSKRRAYPIPGGGKWCRQSWFPTGFPRPVAGCELQWASREKNKKNLCGAQFPYVWLTGGRTTICWVDSNAAVRSATTTEKFLLVLVGECGKLRVQVGGDNKQVVADADPDRRI